MKDPTQETTKKLPSDYLLPLPTETRSSAAVSRTRAGVSTIGSGMRVGDYIVDRELGRGAVGVVYAARHVSLLRRVALKVLLAGEHATVEDVERFQIEARAAARLQHPNIVGIHEVGQDGESWFLAMDLIEGTSLRRRLDDGPFDQREAARICETLARALHYAHTHAILHRDVKPHNILIDDEETVHLTDFGLAKDVERVGRGVTMTGDIVGTPAYMSPEQAGGDPAAIDRRADVYGLGATLYALITGSPPFRGETIIGVLARVVEEPPVPPSRLLPGIDRDLETICLRCLEKEPSARYPSARALAEDLARYMRDEAITARRPSRLERAGRWWRRNRTLAHVVLSAAAVVVVLAIVGVAWFFVSLQTEMVRADEERQRALRAGVELEEALRAAEGSRVEAIEAREEAERQAKLASQREGIALDALMEFDGAISEIAKNPTTPVGAVRKELLEVTRRALDAMGAAHGEDGPLALRAIDVYLSQADAALQTGKSEEAELATREALETARRIAEVDSASVEARTQLIHALNMRGLVLLEMGDVKGADMHYGEAVARARTLNEERPDDLAAKQLLAKTLNRTVGLAIERSPRDALAIVEEVLRLLEQTATRPDRNLVEVLSRLGWLRMQQRDLPGARSAFEDSVAQARVLVARNPNQSRPVTMLVDTLNGLGQLCLQEGSVPATRDLLEEALELARQLVAIDSNAQGRRVLSSCLVNMINFHSRYGELGEASRSAEELVALERSLAKEDPANTRQTAYLASALTDAGQVRSTLGESRSAQKAFLEAAELFRRLVAQDRRNVTIRDELGRTLARAAGIHEDLGELDTAVSSMREALQNHRELARMQPRFKRNAVAMERRLRDLEMSRDLVTGKRDPVSPVEHLLLARALSTRREFGRAVGHYLEALKDSRLWVGGRGSNLYHAAVAAVSAAVATEGDERTRLREQALRWLGQEVERCRDSLRKAEARLAQSGRVQRQELERSIRELKQLLKRYRETDEGLAPVRGSPGFEALFQPRDR